MPCTTNRSWWSESLRAAQTVLNLPHVDDDVSPPRDPGCRESFSEENDNRITGGSGQAGNGAALLGAMGASGFRDGGSAWDWFRETSVHL